MSRTKRSATRVLIFCIGAFLIYGAWSAFSNRLYPSDIIWRSFVLQGGISAFTTLIISGMIEWVYLASASIKNRMIISVLIPGLICSGLHLVVNYVGETPELIQTILPSVIMCFLFGGVYAAGLEKAARATEATATG